MTSIDLFEPIVIPTAKSGALLATKLYVPRARPRAVPRTHLVACLDEVVSQKLTLLSAPAGFGKTVLLAEWIRQRGSPPLSLPVGRVMVQALGAAFQIEILYNFTPVRPLLWLTMITILALLASWLPARDATRLSVRESLAYQ